MEQISLQSLLASGRITKIIPEIREEHTGRMYVVLFRGEYSMHLYLSKKTIEKITTLEFRAEFDMPTKLLDHALIVSYQNQFNKTEYRLALSDYTDPREIFNLPVSFNQKEFFSEFNLKQEVNNARNEENATKITEEISGNFRIVDIIKKLCRRLLKRH